MPIVKFVEFLHPGFVFSDTSSQRIKTEEDIVIPPSACAWRTFEKMISKIAGEQVEGKAKNHSHWVYPGGVEMTADEVIKAYPGDEHRILRSNIEYNKIKRLVKTRHGNMMEMHDGDKVSPR